MDSDSGKFRAFSYSMFPTISNKPLLENNIPNFEQEKQNENLNVESGIGNEEVEEGMTENIPLQTQVLIQKENETKVKDKNNTIKCKCENLSSPCLHILASTGDYIKLKKLLDKIGNDDDENGNENDTIFNSLDKNCRTVLHCAADFKGHPDIGFKCAEIIFDHVQIKLGIVEHESLSENDPKGKKLKKFVDGLDKDKYTALYLAAKRENIKLCDLLLRRFADWDIKSWRGKSPAEKIFKKLPIIIARMIEETTPQLCEYEDGMRSRVIFDFGTIITYPSLEERTSKKPCLYEELYFLSNICYTKLEQRMNILKQPLVKVLIWLKWQKLRWFVFLARIFQIGWFLLYSIFLIVVYRHDCPYHSDIRFKFHYGLHFKPALNTTTTGNTSNSETNDYCESNIGNILVWLLLASLLTDVSLFVIPPIPVRIRRYWRPMKTKNLRKFIKRFFLALRIIHIGKIIFLIIIFLTLLPILITNFIHMTLNWKGWYILAAVGIGLAWFNILIQIGKIPCFKIYIKMLTKVLETLGVVLLIYSSLMIAFGMVFCILLPGVGSYSSPVQAILKMSTFLIGEINYDETFYGDMSKNISVSQGASIIVFALAIVILNIALLNFVIGLTVADIQESQKYHDTWERYSVLWQIVLFDTFLSHFPIQVIGHRLLKQLMLFTPTSYENANPNFKHTIVLDDLPKSLRKEIHLMDLNVCNKINETNQNNEQIQSDSTTIIYMKNSSLDI